MPLTESIDKGATDVPLIAAVPTLVARVHPRAARLLLRNVDGAIRLGGRHRVAFGGRTAMAAGRRFAGLTAFTRGISGLAARAGRGAR